MANRDYTGQITRSNNLWKTLSRNADTEVTWLLLPSGKENSRLLKYDWTLIYSFNIGKTKYTFHFLIKNKMSIKAKGGLNA